LADAAIVSGLNLLSGIVAILISYYAYKNNRLVGSILLRYIGLGFLLLGISLLLQGGTEAAVGTTAIEAVRERALDYVSFIIYTALQVIAYGTFAWGYGLSAYLRKQSPTGAPLPVLAAGTKAVVSAVFALAIYVASQVGVIFLLLLIVIQGVRVFSHSKSNLALMVLFGFALIFGGHLLMLGAVLDSRGLVYVIGNSIEFFGFLSLLIFLVWSGRVVK
jgi:hypothetical protein